MAKNSPSDEVIVDQAQRRAAIGTYLAQNPGEHSVAEIATALDLKATTTGLALKAMAENGLVPEARREGGLNYYRDGGDIAPKRTYTKRAAKTVAPAAKDVELVVGGTMIIIGRNSDTGRIRITLEDLQ